MSRTRGNQGTRSAQSADFNQTTRGFADGATISTLLEAQWHRHPNRIAVICDHEDAFTQTTLTYRELNDKVNQVAHRLRALGAKPDQVVGIMVERSLAMIIGILGVIKAGAAYLPISPGYPRDRISYLLKDAGVEILLLQTQTIGKADFRGTIINLEDGALYQGRSDNPAPVNRAGDLAYVIYTSGSTGTPKGVMIEHRSLINRLSWMQNAYPIDHCDVILQKTPFFFDVSVWELFWFALQGATLCFLPVNAEASPLLIVETIKRHRVSVMHFVPSMLNIFLEYVHAKGERAMTNLESLRQVFASGEALAPSHVRKFNNSLGQSRTRLTNLYGPTEATIDVSYFDCPASGTFAIIPIGKPIDNTRLYVTKDGHELGVGEIGELCIAGAGLARGYLNNPEQTAEKFVQHPVLPGERIYRTGDNARWLPDGNIEYLGREDDQIKLNGLRIELGEIENTIRDFPGVVDCAVVVKKYSASSTPIIAYVISSHDFSPTELRAYAEAKLPHYMVPNHFQRIARLPLGPSGKVNRKALPEPALSGRKLPRQSLAA